MANCGQHSLTRLSKKWRPAVARAILARRLRRHARSGRPMMARGLTFATIPRASMRADGAIRRQLAELAEHQHFLHHAVDAESGQRLTTSPARPPTAQSRIKQLALLGHRFEPSIFGGSTQRLTPRAPHHA